MFPPAEVKSVRLKKTDASGALMGKKSAADVPPPGLGLTTVIEAVDALLMSDARIVAVSLELFMYEVVRATPFHFTTEAGTKPVPFTVNANPAPPGAMVSGISGWLVEGTGFWADAGPANPIKLAGTVKNKMQILQTRIFIL
jgi:hypothetical protein